MGKTLFIKPKSKRLSKIISIESPTAFKRSLRELRKGGFTLKEKRAAVLARNIALVQLERKNLSPKERKQFSAISQIKIPKISK